MNLRIDEVIIRKAVTIEAGESIHDATESMQKNLTSSLIVTKKGKIKGILTTQDVDTRVVAKGLEPAKLTVGEVMSSPVIIHTRMREMLGLWDLFHSLMLLNIIRMCSMNSGRNYYSLYLP